MPVRRALLLAVLACLIAAPAALADGDPASDVLLTQRSYLPYRPKTSPSRAAELAKATAAVQKRNEPIRVALVASPTDLGAVPDFYGRPQEYAKFLSKELELGYHGGLVVVMPAGVGTAKLSAKGVAALRGLKVSSHASSNDLAEVGVFAVQRVAKADGKPIPTVLSEKSGSGVHWWPAVVAVLVAIVLAVGLAFGTRAVRARRQAAPSPSP